MPFKNDFIKDGVYHIFLLGEVDNYNGDAIAESIFNAENYEEIKEIHLHINSEGGNIINGLSVVGAIQNSSKKVVTINEGAALSMGAVIFIAGHYRKMRDYAVLMLHNPSIWGKEPEDFPEGSKERRALETLKKTLVSIIEKNSNLTEEKLNQILNNETWIDAKEAKRLGLADEILKSKQNVKLNNLSDFIKQCSNIVKAEYFKKSEKSQTIKKQNTMLDQIKNTLQVKTDEEAFTKVVELTNKVKDLETKASEYENKVNELSKELENKTAVIDNLKEVVNEKDEEIKALNEKLENYVNKFAEELVDKAIEDGKILKEKREQMINFAKNDVEAFKEFLAAIPKAQKMPDLMDKIEKSSDNRSDWDFERWSKEDPEGLKRMKDENPNLFNKLLSEFTKE